MVSVLMVHVIIEAVVLLPEVLAFSLTRAQEETHIRWSYLWLQNKIFTFVHRLR